MLSRISTALVFACLVAACATSPTGRKQLMIVSESQAIVASRQAYVQEMGKYKKEGKLVTDPKVLNRVKVITERLVAQAVKVRPDSAKWEWTVAVVDDPQNVNAWCMAGGRMAIYTGLILKIDPTDDELAQVLGHEIAHALANHTAERMSVAMASQMGVLAAGILLDQSATTIAAGAAAAQVAVNLPNSRTAETEADRIGIELAAQGGLRPACGGDAVAEDGGRRRRQGTAAVPEHASERCPAPAGAREAGPADDALLQGESAVAVLSSARRRGGRLIRLVPAASLSG